jgi:hypothetical protein
VLLRAKTRNARIVPEMSCEKKLLCNDALVRAMARTTVDELLSVQVAFGDC